MKFPLFFLFILIASSAYALDISSSDVEGVVVGEEDPITSTNITVNATEWWNGEVPFDNAVDLFPYIDVFVNETGDTMTGQLIVQSGNGQIVTSNSAGSIVVQTSGGQAGSISFGNTADIGISQDGVDGTYDYDGSMIFKQKTSNPAEIGEYIFIEENGDWRFALPKSGTDYGTYNPRSMIVAGPSVNNASNFMCSVWGFDNIDCDTGATGADLGVQDDLEVLGLYYGNGTQLTGVAKPHERNNWTNVNRFFNLTINDSMDITFEHISIVGEEYTYLRDGDPLVTHPVITLPVASTSLAGLNLANTWTLSQNFGASLNYIAQYLIHSGDTNTYLQFETDTARLIAGALTVISGQEAAFDSLDIGGSIGDWDTFDVYVDNSTFYGNITVTTTGTFEDIKVNNNINLTGGDVVDGGKFCFNADCTSYINGSEWV